MIVVLPFIAKENDKPLTPGKKYVDCGLNLKTLEPVILPTEEWETFIRENCVYDRRVDGYVLKNCEELQ